MLKRLAFCHTMNTRDLGGYPTPNGDTRYNTFIRSDVPVLLTDDEVNFLLSQKITTVIDLRGHEEVGANPCFLAGKEGFQYHNFPLSGQVPGSEQAIPVSYMQMVENTASMYNIMKTLAESETGIFFHCTAGKDRTGVIAALLLQLVQVPAAYILADYRVSYLYIKAMVQSMKANDPSLPFWLGQSKPEYLLAFFDAFFERYPSVSAYLMEAGLSHHHIAGIKNKFLSR